MHKPGTRTPRARSTPVSIRASVHVTHHPSTSAQPFTPRVFNPSSLSVSSSLFLRGGWVTRGSLHNTMPFRILTRSRIATTAAAPLRLPARPLTSTSDGPRTPPRWRPAPAAVVAGTGDSTRMLLALATLYGILSLLAYRVIHISLESINSFLTKGWWCHQTAIKNHRKIQPAQPNSLPI